MLPIQKLAATAAYFLWFFLRRFPPTFITRQIIYGNPFESGYPAISTWNWTSPASYKVLFSSDHGMFSWTPVLMPHQARCLIGSGNPPYLPVCLLYFISRLSDCKCMSRFRKSFFVSLTPIFILGLTALLSCVFALGLGETDACTCSRHHVSLPGTLDLSINGALILIPARGEISWSTMVHNQFAQVPLRMANSLETYFTHRGEMMAY